MIELPHVNIATDGACRSSTLQLRARGARLQWLLQRLLTGWATPVRMASSSNFGGATLEVLRLIKRSMTSAMARMEQAISGQIGQPAACMMENNGWSFTQIGGSVIMAHRFCG